MMRSGRFYMHEKSMDVCVEVLEPTGNSMYKVVWWNLGYVGTPWPLDTRYDEIYMHPGVWKDITDFIKLPREQWS